MAADKVGLTAKVAAISGEPEMRFRKIGLLLTQLFYAAKGVNQEMRHINLISRKRIWYFGKTIFYSIKIYKRSPKKLECDLSP